MIPLPPRSLLHGLAALLLAAASTHLAEPVPAEADALQVRADALYDEGSFAAAHEIYARLAALDLPPRTRRWIDFRSADSSWRSVASSGDAPEAAIERARRDLEALIDAVEEAENRDRVWAEAHESLADLAWERPRSRDWGRAWSHYEPALDWWAGAVDVELARERYLGMVWKMARPRDAEPYYVYGYYGNTLPLSVIENARRIAREPADRARAHYLLAMTLRGTGAGSTNRVVDAFEQALEAGRATPWYDDALYHYAEWMRDRGVVVYTDDGRPTTRPDYVKALELFRRLTTELGKGETRYYDRAVQEIRGITEPVVDVRVASVFLPGSEIEYHVAWRNVGTIELELRRVDLTRDVAFGGSDVAAQAWLSRVEPADARPYRSWSHATQDPGDHRPGNETLRLSEPLPGGAYLLLARAGAARSRELVLVTDAALVLKTSGRQALAYVADAIDGSPVAGARVTLWSRRHDGSRWSWSRHAGEAGDDGLVVFELPNERASGRQGDVFAAAERDGRQAFALTSLYRPARVEGRWRIQAYTDRPAYRPGETVQWKVLGRTHDGAVYSTPEGRALDYTVVDPRGVEAFRGRLRLNAFGTAWDSFETTPALALGEYRIRFATAEEGRGIGEAVLFRLEEYKLPEFRVSVQVPRDGERSGTFRLGESVPVEIAAEYYFGGPVSEASVEVLVQRKPYYHHWQPPREFPWYYADSRPAPDYYGGGSLVERRTLTTDAEGRARLEIDTPAEQGSDLEYRIEARVTDASRREIAGSGSVRVTRAPYYVDPRPEHNLYRPQDEVTFLIRTIDANGQPVPAQARVSLTRDRWYEVWIDPHGNEVSGDALRRARQRIRTERGWRLRESGYRHQEILERGIASDAEGRAELRFVPHEEGLYRMRWVDRATGAAPVIAESTVWVASDATRELGLRHGGLEIIVDRDTFRAGQVAPVMLLTPTNDRWVLFGLEAEELLDYRVVHVEGSAKLLQVELDERHVPNVFLTGAMVSDASLFVDTEQVVVPPTDRFLEVEVEYDRRPYRPREEGLITLRTRDRLGRPVSAELSLGLVDESVYAIQPEYASDPRQFFFGQTRSLLVGTASSFQQRRYVELALGEAAALVDLRADVTLQDTAGGEDERFAATEGLAGRDRAIPRPMRETSPGIVGKAAIAEEAVAQAPPGERSEETPAVEVRSDFRSTVLWRPDIVTDRDGVARVEVTFPDSLTGWRATARVATRDNRFGMVTADTRTHKPLIARLQAPRFFVVGDSSVVSAVIHNDTEQALRVTPSLALEGPLFVQDGGAREPVDVPAQGELRVDWRVTAREAGTASITVAARGDVHADAMRREYPVHEHGIEKLVARSGKLRGEAVDVVLPIPAARRPGSTRLTVQLAPSLAITLLDALPYLADYPYGCTEQTMSRFLPATIAAKALADLGLDARSVRERIFGGIEPAHAARTHPGGQQDLDRLDEMVAQGQARLDDFQHADGGWGWWKEGESDPFMTAYVVWGLGLARDAGVRIDAAALERGVAFLDRELVAAESRLDLQAWMLHALAVERAGSGRRSMTRFQETALDNLWERRTELNAYARALLALAAQAYGDAAKAATLVRNLENGVVVDRTPDVSAVQPGAASSRPAAIGTAHWGRDGIYYRWSEGGVEATAFALRALLAIDPGHELIEPATHWLIRNRRGAQWSNTRDTAIVVLALVDYLRVSGESRADVDYELLVNGRSVARRRLAGDAALADPGRFEIDPSWVVDGENRVRIVRHGGAGPLYFSAEARFFSLEEPVTPAGNELFVRRRYQRVVGRETLLGGYVYDRRPLDDGDAVASGERVEVRITVETKNNLEYLVFEDLKPAGLEATSLRSGEPLFAREVSSGEMRPVHQELRDRQVALFADRLPQGVWEIRYELRAETPGEFHALPPVGHAMYVPEIRGNGGEVRVRVLDR